MHPLSKISGYATGSDIAGATGHPKRAMPLSRLHKLLLADLCRLHRAAAWNLLTELHTLVRPAGSLMIV